MILQEHLLAILAEECNEVAHRASKALRFGLRDIGPGQTKNNAELIVEEFSQLLAMMNMLHDQNLIPAVMDPREFAAKFKNVEKFLEYSRQQGTLTD
jgi:hypothetical protein